MTRIEQLTLNAVAHISASKALDGISPTHALLREVLEIIPGLGVREALWELVKAGRIIYGRTINDTYFKVKTNEL